MYCNACPHIEYVREGEVTHNWCSISCRELAITKRVYEVISIPEWCPFLKDEDKDEVKNHSFVLGNKFDRNTAHAFVMKSSSNEIRALHDDEKIYLILCLAERLSELGEKKESK